MGPHEEDRLDREARSFVYEHFVEHGLPPTAERAAAHLGVAPERTRAAFERLDERHALFLDPESREVRMAFPFSGVPPEAVLGFYAVVLRYHEKDLHCAFFSTRFSRVLDGLGYAGSRDWRIYAKEGLARREAAVWLQPGSISVEYAGETLSVYDVELASGGEAGRLRSVGRPRLFETSYVLPQLKLFALNDAGWLKVLRLEGYAPRRSRHPTALQDVLFPYLDAL